MIDHTMSRIFNFFPLKRNDLLLVLPLVLLAPAHAQSQVAVLEDDFSCILQNAEDYREQGDQITLNFETCPERPTTREELQAHDARNHFPPRTDADAGSTLNGNSPALLVTKQEFDCLLASLAIIESDPATGRLIILPDDCQVDKP